MKGYHATRITRYPNSVATFNQDRLATTGDISLNPGPDRIVSDNGKNRRGSFHALSAISQCVVIRREFFATVVTVGITLSALIWMSRLMSL